MIMNNVAPTPSTIGNIYVLSGSRTATSLNSAYVNNTSGAGVAVRYMASTADSIDEFYIMLDAITGTRANITMTCIINNESGASRAGSTTRATSTATTMPSADDKWIKFTFGTPYTPVVGEVLWFIAYNASASPTVDYPQILTGTTIQLANIISSVGRQNTYTTTMTTTTMTTTTTTRTTTNNQHRTTKQQNNKTTKQQQQQQQYSHDITQTQRQTI